MFNGALCAPGERCRAPGECIADSARDGGTPDAGDACLEVDCDDRNSCTDDSCEAGVCVHAPNGAECDDGVYCNGGDRCAAGSCGSHAGDPCEGLSCDEGADRCLGCGPALPCPEPSCGPYGECDYASACATNGSRARTCTTFTCTSGTCVPSTRTETDTAGCARSTTGMSCSPTTCTAFGACGGFASTCDPTGAQSRTCTDYTCAAGMCAGTRRSDSQSCMRPTDGLSCGASTCGPWGACDYASTCDETATQTRSCNGAICASGSCISGMPNIESQDCIRDTDGAACGTGLACAGGSCGACPSGYGDCDGRTTNGCETSLVFPNCYGCDTCGANADRCGSGPDHRCSCGTRGYGCTQAGQICCGGSCRPPTDPDNCGACGRRCGDNQACSSGACVCASGWEDCNGDPGDGCETDLSGTNDCGACGATCADGETCTGGRCECFGNLGAPGGGAACLANRICCDALMRCAYPGVCE
ncbi:MAG: hypothetical protein IT378_01890 [Sandaracinaceae bacterium]|nr:hypothetical protein [Sandaracinaceae bacterium]